MSYHSSLHIVSLHFISPPQKNNLSHHWKLTLHQGKCLTLNPSAVCLPSALTFLGQTVGLKTICKVTACFRRTLFPHSKVRLRNTVQFLRTRPWPNMVTWRFADGMWTHLATFPTSPLRNFRSLFSGPLSWPRAEALTPLLFARQYRRKRQARVTSEFLPASMAADILRL